MNSTTHTISRRIVIVNPLASGKPTGIGIASTGLGNLIHSENWHHATRANAIFQWINDKFPLKPLRLLLRFLLAQLIPLCYSKNAFIVFTSHHGPIWKSKKHAIIVYDLIPLHYPDQAKMQTLYYRKALPKVIKAAQEVVTISQATKNDITKCWPEFNARTIHVIPAVSDRIDSITSSNTPLAVRLAKKTFLFVGARYEHKNLNLLIRAISHIHDKSPDLDYNVVVIGTDESVLQNTPNLATYIEKGIVKTHGYIDDTTLSELYNTATCLIYPSLIEGQGLPPLEAMTRGCPVICSRIDCLIETCDDAALYVDPTNETELAAAMLQFIQESDKSEIRKRVEKGFSQINRFKKVKIKEEWIRFIEKLT